MEANRLDHYRALLEEQLDSIGATAREHQEQIGNSHETGDFVGGDRAAELESMEVDSNVTDSEFRLAEKIRHALDRIENGSYGTCEGCGGEIPAARLDAKPSVSLCIPCQEKHEEDA